MSKVAKFGGTSLASAESFRRVRDILESDTSRRFVVPSAPGKEHSDDIKVTDLLSTLQETIVAGGDPLPTWKGITQRFSRIVDGLGLNLDIGSMLRETYDRIVANPSRDFVSSRGETLNGRILAHYLAAEYVEAAKVIRFDANGRFDPSSYALIAGRCQGAGRYVIPGFYGARADGSVCTFSRGGSDISGAVVATALDAEVYENWTDTSGFYMADPRIVHRPMRIREMTFSELRELSYMGASVFHDAAIFPVRSKGIPINIRNTFEPDHHGTLILPSRQSHGKLVTGIAGKRDFSVFSIEKSMMNEEIGFGRQVLEVFERFGVGWEHAPSGIDTLSIVVARDAVADKETRIREQLWTLRPDRVEVIHGIALVATVGQGMNHATGTAARLFGALSQAGVNIRLIDQGSSEQNIIVGVDNNDFEAAIRAIYAEFA